MQIPLIGDQNDFSLRVMFPCSTESSNYTITLVGSDGTHLYQRWTDTNTGDMF